MCGWDDRIKIKHLQHTHNNGEQKKLNKVYKSAIFLNVSPGLSVYHISGKGKGAPAVFWGCCLYFFRKRCYGLLFWPCVRACCIRLEREDGLGHFHVLSIAREI